MIAHEVGHYIQTVTNEPRGDSVAFELQADCYAGVWAHSVFGPGGDVTITDDDVREALDAAAAIGDDRLQEQAGVEVDPDTWTHGSSEQRQDAFDRGFDGGRVDDCAQSR